MKKIILLLLIPLASYSQKPTDIFEPGNAYIKKILGKENFTKNDVLVIKALNQIIQADQLIVISKSETLSKTTLVIVSSNISGAYVNMIVKGLKLTEDEVKVFKSFINRSASYLFQNLDKHKATEKTKKLHLMAYQDLLLASEKFNHKVEEAKKLLKRFKEN